MRQVLCCILAVSIGSFLTGCESEPEPGENRLTGKITVKGKPAKRVMIIVSGADGKETGGQTKEDGTYLVLDPPTGPLTFYLTDMSSGPGRKGMIPAKYTKPGNDLKHTFEGGEETYDIEL